MFVFDLLIGELLIELLDVATDVDFLEVKRIYYELATLAAFGG